MRNSYSLWKFLTFCENFLPIVRNFYPSWRFLTCCKNFLPKAIPRNLSPIPRLKFPKVAKRKKSIVYKKYSLSILVQIHQIHLKKFQVSLAPKILGGRVNQNSFFIRFFFVRFFRTNFYIINNIFKHRFFLWHCIYILLESPEDNSFYLF